jgi:hypothetical protein
MIRNFRNRSYVDALMSRDQPITPAQEPIMHFDKAGIMKNVAPSTSATPA